MNNYGYIKVAAAIPSVKVGDCNYNVSEIEKMIVRAEGMGVEIIVFPELSITGYTCQDLFRQKLLIDAAEMSVMKLMEFSRQLNIIIIIGAPVAVGGLLLNCAVVIQCGEVLGIIPKTFLPNYSEFYEKRWFASSQDLHPTDILYAGSKIHITPQPTIFQTYTGATFGIELCEAAEVVLELVEFLLAGAEAVAFHHPAGKKSQRDEQHGEREFAWVVAQHKIDCRGTKNQHVGG